MPTYIAAQNLRVAIGAVEPLPGSVVTIIEASRTRTARVPRVRASHNSATEGLVVYGPLGLCGDGVHVPVAGLNSLDRPGGAERLDCVARPHLCARLCCPRLR